MSGAPRRHHYTWSDPRLKELFTTLTRTPPATSRDLTKILRRFPQSNGDLYTLPQLREMYQDFLRQGVVTALPGAVLKLFQRKPVRTISGVTPVTVLTKPFPCPGKCIFCPNDIRMPKSYLADEPGAQRAERNYFDPYLQTWHRLEAYQQMGHSIAKVELIVLGGTWSYYPEEYQVWFIKECFRALNDMSEALHQNDHDENPTCVQRQLQYQAMTTAIPHVITDPLARESLFESNVIDGEQLQRTYNQVVSGLYVAPERKLGFDQWQRATWEQLETEHHRNELGTVRCVGLVLETRPDNISPAEVTRLRRLGSTKTQIGVQSLSDDVLTKNHRGHDVAATRRAFRLLRQAGFKIHAHWMPNLYGSSPQQDKEDFVKLFSDPDFHPDELKIYPCSLIQSAELMQYYQRGVWRPYTQAELMDVLAFCFRHTPEYCRLTRVIRDIPSTDIVAGNKRTNFREVVERTLVEAGDVSRDIRAREVRGKTLDPATLQLDIVRYHTAVAEELFLQFITPERTLAAFLRLSLPKSTTPAHFIAELHGSAIIREVHVYGQSLAFGERVSGRAQHEGLGTRLLEEAKRIATASGFTRLAVISAIGTRPYYRQRGFVDGKLYQFWIAKP